MPDLNKLVQNTPVKVKSLSEIESDHAVVFSEETEEYIANIELDSIKKFIPKETYKHVHRDNKLFLDEKLVFSDAFFKTTAELS